MTQKPNSRLVPPDPLDPRVVDDRRAALLRPRQLHLQRPLLRADAAAQVAEAEFLATAQV